MITQKKRQLIKQFHTVCTKSGIDRDERREIVESFGRESSRDLSERELEDIIRSISDDGDKWRKRVLASVGSWLRNSNIDHTPAMIKAIACRASGYSHFNSIPVSRLRDIYYEFVRKGKTVGGVQEFKSQVMRYLETYN